MNTETIKNLFFSDNEMLGSLIREFSEKNTIRMDSAIVIYALNNYMIYRLILNMNNKAKFIIKGLHADGVLLNKKIKGSFLYKVKEKVEKKSELYSHDGVEKEVKTNNFNELSNEVLGKMCKFKIARIIEKNTSMNDKDTISFIMANIYSELSTSSTFMNTKPKTTSFVEKRKKEILIKSVIGMALTETVFSV